MRSLLEQAVIHHLNGDAEQAQDLMHQFIVARARQIHEAMRNGEDVDGEAWDQEVVEEEYFTEADLSELTDGEGEGEEGAEDDADMGMDMGEPEVDAEADADAAADLGADLEVADDAEERLEELTTKLEDLAARFEEILGGDEGMDAEADADLGADMEAGAEGDEFTFDAEGSEEEAGDEDDAEAMKDDMSDEDDIEEGFDDLAESVVSELEKITADLTTDGKEIAAGKAFAQQGKSTLPQKGIAARQGGEPVRLKSTNHTGFDRETAPAVKDMKKRRNNVKTANAALSGVAAPKNSKEGSEVGAGGKSAKPNTKSPLSGLKK